MIIIKFKVRFNIACSDSLYENGLELLQYNEIVYKTANSKNKN